QKGQTCHPFAGALSKEGENHTDDRGEYLDRGKSRGDEVSWVSGQQQLVLYLLQVSDRCKPLNETASAQDDRSDRPLGKRLGKSLLAERVFAIHGEAICGRLLNFENTVTDPQHNECHEKEGGDQTDDQ